MNRTLRPNLVNGKTKLSPTTKTKWRKASARRWASAEAEAEAIIDQISLESGSSSDDDALQKQDRSQQKISTHMLNKDSCTHYGTQLLSPTTLEPCVEETNQNSETPSRFPSQTKFFAR